MQQLKTLVLDIETLPLICFVWQRRDQNITLEQVKKDWSLASFAAKWLHEPPSNMIYADNSHKTDAYDDKELLLKLWKLLNQADIVITQNGEKFDSRKINARFILQGINPPSPYRHFDTYKLSSQVASFTSHSLEYVTEKCNKKYKKLKHKRFPGWSLWIECISGNKEAWKEMKKYNIHDVLATEEWYENLKAWAPEKMPKPYLVSDTAKECATCGHVGHLKLGKPRHTKRFTYVQHQCTNCGSFQSGERIR